MRYSTDQRHHEATQGLTKVAQREVGKATLGDNQHIFFKKSSSRKNENRGKDN